MLFLLYELLTDNKEHLSQKEKEAADNAAEQIKKTGGIGGRILQGIIKKGAKGILKIVMRYLLYFVYRFILLIVAVKLSRCHHKGNILNLVFAVLLSPIYVISMLLKGKLCIAKE